MDIKNHEYYLIRISEFLDGELSPDETRELFNYIANNPELQEELKSSIAVRNMFHQELIPPPKNSKILLYGKLNLQKSAAILSLFLSIFTHFRRFIMNPAVGSALVGIGIFLLGFYTAEFAKKQSNPATSSKIVSPQISNSEKEPIPIVQSKELNGTNVPFVPKANQPPKIARSEKNNKPNSNIAAITVLFNNNQDNLIQNIPTNNDETTNLNQINYDRLIYSATFAPINQHIGTTTIKRSYPEIDYLISSFLDKMSIGISKSNSTSNIKNDLEPLSNPMLNDYSVAIGYNLNESNVIAIEFGQENYPQRYTGVINESEAVINQVYTAQWYGVSYQYNFDGITDKMMINPFIKILSSLTKVGPFFKGSLGMNYSINDKLILNIGLESSTLLYEFQGKNFNTTKYGIFYGAKINF